MCPFEIVPRLIVAQPTKSGKRRLAETEPVEEKQIIKRLKATREEAQKFNEEADTHVPKIQRSPKRPAPSASGAEASDNAIPTSHAEKHPAPQSDVDQSIHAAHDDPLSLPTLASDEVQPAPLAQPAQLVQQEQPQPAQSAQPTLPAQPSNLGHVRYVSWKQAYKVGLERCEQNKPNRSLWADPTTEMPKAIDTTYLDTETVDQAIASVWIALRPGEATHPINFSLVDCRTSTQIQCEQGHHFISVDDSDTLIIPILLNVRNAEELRSESPKSSRPAPPEADLPWNWQMAQHRKLSSKEDQNQGSESSTNEDPQAQPTSASDQTPPATSSEKTLASDEKKVKATPVAPALGKDLDNHLVLAVARREPLSGNVRMHYYNSGRILGNHDKIRAAARNSVRHSAWLKNTWPKFTEERWIRVRQQLFPTCGYHVIFNAWAVMLGIRVDLAVPEIDSEGDEEDMKKIVTLAIQGRIDADLIRAFLHVFGFARHEPCDQWYQRQSNPTSETDSTRYNMKSVLMTDEIYREYVRQLRDDRYNSEPDAGATTSHNGGDDPADDEDPPDGNGGDGGDGENNGDQDGGSGGDHCRGHEIGEDDVSDLFSGWLPIDGPITDQASTEGEKNLSQKKLDSTSAATGNPKDGETAQSHSSGAPRVTAAAPSDHAGPVLSPEQHSHQAKGNNSGPSSALSMQAYVQKQREQVLADSRKIKDHEAGSTSRDSAPITSHANLTGHHILMAITSLWRALLGREQSTEPGSSRSEPIFSLPIGNEQGAVGSTRRLLFPLSFHTPGPDGSIGPRHYVLCLAVFDGEDEVLIEHYDSSITPTSQTTAQEQAERYVTNAQWLPIGNQAERAGPRIRHSHLLVPQMLLPNSSGVLVVLNAWMLLLRLEPRVGSSPNNGFQTSDRFLEGGRALIDLALAGRLYTVAIQAFLTAWGLTEATTVQVTPVRTVPMTSAIMARIGGRRASATATTRQPEKDSEADQVYKMAIEAGTLNASDAEDSVRSDRSSASPPNDNAGMSTFHHAAIRAGDPFDSIETPDRPLTDNDPVAAAYARRDEEHDDPSVLRVTPEYESWANLLESFGDSEGAERWRTRKWRDDKYKRHELEY